MSLERLQKILARSGAATSRRKAEELIRDGRVTVNGAIADLGARADADNDAIKVDGKRVHPPRGPRHYLLVNKPRGYVSTRYDPEGRPTLIDLVPQRYRDVVLPVGRLDFDTEGLIILTDDGDFAQRIAHPRHGCGKTYEVKVKGRPDAVKIDKLRAGIVLDGRRTAPADIRARRVDRQTRDALNNSWWTVVLKEGRTRQIREMFFRIGHPVAKLRRTAIGALTDSYLPRGAWRELTEHEVASLRSGQWNERQRPAPQQRRRRVKPKKR
ncbi:MAG: pseudouridine synthase [Acidobacteriota bacterium]